MKTDPPIGARYGRLVVLHEASSHTKPSGQKSRMMYCRCDCGTEITASLSNLKRSNTLSCGCLQREIIGQSAMRHGHSKGDIKSAAYTAWVNMRERCSNPMSTSFKTHGARGITVCDSWSQSFERFLSDMGERPSSKHSLDRYPNNDGNYEPGNCRWATSKEQNRNKRSNAYITHDGKTKTIAEWAEISGVQRYTLKARIVKWGWPISRALQNFDGRAKA